MENKNKKMNIFAYLKHLWKDPVNDVEEANARKKEIMPFFLVPLGAVIVLMILVGIIPSISDTLTAVAMVFAFVACAPGFMLWMIHKIKQKFKDIICDKCKTRMQNGDNISYKVLGVRETRSQRDGKITITKYTNIKFECTCQNCGAQKTFTHEFKAVNADIAPEVLVEEYFGNIIR